jgi:hypothetical protein
MNSTKSVHGLDDAEWVRRRLPVWVGLSELFRDTELQAEDLVMIASGIRQAGFTKVEAEAILTREVAPVFVSNLMSIAGEWAGWSDEVVRDAVVAHLQTGAVRQWLARLYSRLGKGLYWPAWNMVAVLLR